jgi:hypothetical protein
MPDGNVLVFRSILESQTQISIGQWIRWSVYNIGSPCVYISHTFSSLHRKCEIWLWHIIKCSKKLIQGQQWWTYQNPSLWNHYSLLHIVFTGLLITTPSLAPFIDRITGWAGQSQPTLVFNSWMLGQRNCCFSRITEGAATAWSYLPFLCEKNSSDWKTEEMISVGKEK